MYGLLLKEKRLSQKSEIASFYLGADGEHVRLSDSQELQKPFETASSKLYTSRSA